MPQVNRQLLPARALSHVRHVLITGVLAGGLLAGCTEDLGKQIGTAVGDVGGSLLARADVPYSGTIGGMSTVVGALIGAEIARYLNAQERVQAETAARESLSSGTVGSSSTRTWVSKTNPEVSGGSTVIARKVNADGRECRVQRNFANVKGKDVEQSETLCRDPNTGAWAAQAA